MPASPYYLDKGGGDGGTTSEVTVMPIKGEDPETEYAIRRRKKKLTPDQEKKISSSMPFDGPGSAGGGGVGY